MNLPDGVTVSYENNTLTDAGSTVATATFTGDETPLGLRLNLFLLSAAVLLMMGERKRQRR